MFSFLIRWVVTAVAVLVAAFLLPGVDFHENYLSLWVMALVLGVLNAILRPILLITTLPLNILTLGLLTLVINALLFWLAGSIAPGFTIEGFWSAFFGALIVSVVSFILNSFLVKKGHVEVYRGKSVSRRDDNVIDV